MTTRTTAYITKPSHEQLETAWWELMQGELGLDRDRDAADFMQTMFGHVSAMVRKSVPVLASDDEPLVAVSGAEMARRMVAAYASLFYGV